VERRGVGAAIEDALEHLHVPLQNGILGVVHARLQQTVHEMVDGQEDDILGIPNTHIV
jgi:hypothetical protein